MKLFIYTVIVFFVSVIGYPLHADYTMMCTFFEQTKARVYKVSDEGNIMFQYDLTVTQGGEVDSATFAPNGKWGLLGGLTTYYPPTQITTVLSVDKNYYISVLGFVHNEEEELVSISPDSRYGVYGHTLQTLRYYGNGRYQVIPTNNPGLAAWHAPFSYLNKRLYGINETYIISEYALTADGVTTSTGFTINTYPIQGNYGLFISPDGKTCLVLGGSGALSDDIAVLRIFESGGMNIVQKFRTSSLSPWDVDFTPDSKYAIVSYRDSSKPSLRSFRIGDNSVLTEIAGIPLPNYAGEDMAVTPDGKFAITRALVNNQSLFYVVRIHENGMLEYLPENDYVCTGHVSDIAFVPPQKTEVESSWNCYE